MTMGIEHTKGPWEASDGWLYGAGDEAVCEYAGCGTHEAVWPNPADLALAQAAPELLEALVLARAELAGLPHSLGYNFTHLPKIDAAIAKATGAPA
jgi:hypothetical protein